MPLSLGTVDRDEPGILDVGAYIGDALKLPRAYSFSAGCGKEQTFAVDQIG